MMHMCPVIYSGPAISAGAHTSRVDEATVNLDVATPPIRGVADPDSE